MGGGVGCVGVARGLGWWCGCQWGWGARLWWERKGMSVVLRERDRGRVGMGLRLGAVF